MGLMKPANPPIDVRKAGPCSIAISRPIWRWVSSGYSESL